MHLFNIISVSKAVGGAPVLIGRVADKYFALSFSTVTKKIADEYPQDEGIIIVKHVCRSDTWYVRIEISISYEQLYTSEISKYFTFYTQIVEKTEILNIGNENFNYQTYGITPLAWTVATGMIVAVL